VLLLLDISRSSAWDLFCMLLHLHHSLHVSLVVSVLLFSLMQDKAIREHAGKVLEERPLLVASVGS